MRQPIYKSSGQMEFYSAQKLRRSIARTGLHPTEVKKITAEVTEKIKPGSTTQDIYKHTVKLINRHSPIAATHYSLKNSLLDLGPTGYEFEALVAKYFEAIGFISYQDIVLQGEFVHHEVDVIASKPNYQIYVECKFHNNNSHKNDIKVALYVKARWDDLKNGPDGKYLKEFYLASNTTFTKDAVTYAKGVGLNLLGVNAPEDESFLDKIKSLKLYPITCLRRLKSNYCKDLLSKKIILCSELLNERRLLLKIGLSTEEINGLFNDINKLLNQDKNIK